MKTSLLRRFWVTFSAWVIGSYASGLNRFACRGAEHLPASGGVLIAANHISAYDTILIPWAVVRIYPFQMLWAPAKEELFKGFPGWLYRSWGAFPVKRGRDVRAGKVLNELLRDQKVMLFPEGTRHKDGVLGSGNRGVGKIIYDTHPTVIPTALIGLNHWRFPGLGQKATIVFGEPLNFSEFYSMIDGKETHQKIVDTVMAAIAGLLKQEGAYVEPR